MELRQLRYFVGVAEQLHYGRAAQKLFVSQSALSQQIKLLEQELGMELFLRSERVQFRRVILTQAGELLLAKAKSILDLSDQTIFHLRELSTQQQTINLAVFKLILPQRIMGMLEIFSTHFPSAQIKLIELQNPVSVQEYVLSGQADLGMSVRPLLFSELSAIQYTETDYRILMHRNHPQAQQVAVQLNELKKEQWIDHGRENGLYFEQLGQACHRAGFDRESNIVQYVPSFDLLKSMVGLGKGVAFVPESLDIAPEPNLVSRPIINDDGSPFKDVVIEHIMAYKSGKPIVEAMAKLVRHTPFSSKIH